MATLEYIGFVTSPVPVRLVALLDEIGDFRRGRATIVGTPAEVIDIVGQYREVGLDELIVPDFTFGPLKRKKESMDLFIEQVAPEFR